MLRIAAGRQDRNLANEWADRMVQIVEKNPTDLILVLADMARANVTLSSAFVTELTRHLHGQSPYFGFATSWMEHRLQDQGLTIEQLVQAENQNQAADQVSIGNSITSLRFLSSMDWRDFVEEMSIVEQILRGEPAGIYPAMDFATRDRYRHSIEAIAKRSHLQRIRNRPQGDQALRDGFLRTAEPDHRACGLLPRRQRSAGSGAHRRDGFVAGADFGQAGRRFPLPFICGAVLLITCAATAGLLVSAHRHGLGAVGMSLLGVLAIAAAMHLGVGIANWLAMLTVDPHPLPRMDYSEGIPPERSTIVVIPTMLTLANIEGLLEGLEVRYLANRDRNVRFALLTDFKDAAQETLPDDQKLVQLASAGIAGLNVKYAGDRANIFFLAHRPRRGIRRNSVGSDRSKARQTGGIQHAVLRERPLASHSNGDDAIRTPRDRFSIIVGDISALMNVRYVITLDTDTQLPRNVARELVGTMAHPLNQPVIDAESGRVVNGYGILQPRVGVSLPSASRSWFVRLFAGDPGIDPYTRAVSDVYQDVFAEGSFIGKGIYDVDAFEKPAAISPKTRY